MPIAVGASFIPPPPPPPSPPDPTVTDRIQVVWTAPDGSDWPLTLDGQPWQLQNAAQLFGVAPVALATDPYPLFGARVRHDQPQPRIITLPVQVRAADSVTFRAAWRALGVAFAQTRRLGPGTLTVFYADGTSRQIRAWYQAGYDGQPGSGWFDDTAVVALFCEDPFWSDTVPTTVFRDHIAASSPFLNPFLTVSSSRTLGDTVINNPGDVEAWPVWTITGPTSGLDATNNTTGQSFSLDPNATDIAHGNLLLGETVTITTLAPTVRGPGGAVWTAALNWPGARLWWLEPGDNHVTFSASGSGTGTSVTLRFYPRYELA
jgi:hypothetical protein